MTIQAGKTIGTIAIIAIVSILLISIDSAGGTGTLVVLALLGFGIYTIIRYPIQHAIRHGITPKSELSHPATPQAPSTSTTRPRSG